MIRTFKFVRSVKYSEEQSRSWFGWAKAIGILEPKFDARN
jgi:hypothetical protein